MAYKSKEQQREHSRLRYQEHRESIRAYQKRYYQEHREQILERVKGYRQERYQEINAQRRLRYQQRPEAVREGIQRSILAIKTEVLTHYGNGTLACVMCGESRLPCLSIDHICGGGNKHRTALGLRGSTTLYRWLKREGFPLGYQTLCANCQWMKRFEAKEWKNPQTKHLSPLLA